MREGRARGGSAVGWVVLVAALPACGPLAPGSGASSSSESSVGASRHAAVGSTGPATQAGVVGYVVDGDTIDVAGVGRVRLIGMDAPERDACGHEAASRALSALVLGERVTLVPGAVDDFDRYGRLLRYVDVRGVDAGLRLIEQGWAIARYDSRDGYGRHAREAAYVAADLASPDLGCYPASRRP